MQIRRINEEEIPTLADLYASAVHALGPTAYSAAQVSAWAASVENHDAFRNFVLNPTTLVACDSSGVLGFCGLEDGGRVASIYVRPDRFGEGVATRLLQHVIEAAKGAGMERLFAEASEFSRPLFLKLGFRAIGTEIVERNGETFVRHVVSLDLPPAQCNDSTNQRATIQRTN